MSTSTTDPESVAVYTGIYGDVYPSVYSVYGSVNFKIPHMVSVIIYEQLETVIARSLDIDLKPAVHSILETYVHEEEKAAM